MTALPGLDPAYAAELIRRQASLQAEARRVVDLLNLPALLLPAGDTVQHGSSVLGLMVWRDIDFDVWSPELTAERAFAILQPLLTRPDLAEVRHLNFAGERAFGGRLEESRYYFILFFEFVRSEIWKFDLSFWLAGTPHREVIPEADLARRLTSETRLAILWIKDVWYRLPAYRNEVHSVDIYRAVLDHGVRSPTEFASYLERRG